MRLRQYLNELTRNYPTPRSQSIYKQDAIDYIRRRCGKYTKLFKNKKVPLIYRGIRSSNDDFLYIDPRKGLPRLSANTYNYVTLMMDNLPSWKKYPKRSRSIICSSNVESAKSYGMGTTYVVIPFDRVTIGVCPDKDIWLSFKKPLNTSVSMFNGFLHKLIRKYGNDLSGSETSWKTFKNEMYNIVNYYYDEIKDVKSIEGRKEMLSMFSEWSNNYYFPVLRAYFSKKHKSDIIDHFDYYFSPEYNGFKLNDLKGSLDNEIWIGNAPSILIKEGWFDAIMNEV